MCALNLMVNKQNKTDAKCVSVIFNIFDMTSFSFRYGLYGTEFTPTNSHLNCFTFPIAHYKRRCCKRHWIARNISFFFFYIWSRLRWSQPLKMACHLYCFFFLSCLIFFFLEMERNMTTRKEFYMQIVYVTRV